MTWIARMITRLAAAVRVAMAPPRSPVLLIAVVGTLLAMAWAGWQVTAAAYGGADAELVRGSLGSRLALAALALAALFGCLRLFDHLGGVRFGRVLDSLALVPMAQAIYYGLRLLGVALLLGLLLG